ncbi:putative AdoMet-dependent methyltransferase [Thermoflexales bacterium]|nr:putative AdoMet-dependent methyltransferase [Thermoflexales bacterium]
MDEQHSQNIQLSYDRVAEEYARRTFDELLYKPLDRQLLDRLVTSVEENGLICDLGCGPGQIARYLHERGARVMGVDLSAQMIELARRLNPGLEFKQGNMLALDVEDEAWAGIAAFYSLIHIPREEVVNALHELKRVLRPGGWLLLAFHIGTEVVHIEEWWELPVSADFVYFQAPEMQAYLQAAGFLIKDLIERPPYPDVEHQSHRAYILARKPA